MSRARFMMMMGCGGNNVATTTWNPADKNASIALSGGNLIATASGAAAYKNVRSTTSVASGVNVDKILKWTPTGSHGDRNFGLANASAPLNTYAGGTDLYSIATYMMPHDVYYNDTIVHSFGASLANAAYFLSFKFETETVVISYSTDGSSWTSSGSETRPSGNLFFMGSLQDAGETQTVDFAPTGWTKSGAQNWG